MLETIDSQRETAKRNREKMTAAQRAAASRLISDRFLNSRYFLSSQSIGCYLASPFEVDTAAIIERAWRAKKRIFVPVIRSNGFMSFCVLRRETNLVRNRFGLWEPEFTSAVSAKSLDVVVTPTVAIDRQGNRIGMGGGYYDRAFQFLRNRGNWRRPKLVGLAFECQRVKKIAPNPWDIPLSCVLTEC